MESLVFFIIIIAVNILSKTVQEKKKIERAKVKRAKQLSNNPLPNVPNQAQRTQPIREKAGNDRGRKELLKEKRDKEYYDRKQEYIDSKKEKQRNYNSANYNFPIKEDKTKDILEVEGHGTVEQLAAQKEIKRGFAKEGLERKKLINAVIWAEILGEPKSSQNIKKGM